MFKTGIDGMVVAEDTADNSANIPEVLAHAVSAQMNTVCQEEIQRVADIARKHDDWRSPSAGRH